MPPIFSDFHIHGDNIVECERTIDLIKASFKDQLVSIVGPIGSPVCPQFQFNIRENLKPLRFTFFPGFSRWNEDVLQLVRERGGILREAPDAIITRVTQSEEPLLAIEYCGALPAGNQAWQRNGRAYSFGLARVPYLYVAELGGYELDANRNRRSPRMPNPAVPFSYLSYSLEKGTPVLPIFITSPGADESSRRAHKEEFADNELITLIRTILLGLDPHPTLQLLRQKVLSLVKKRAQQSTANKTLKSGQWEEAYTWLEQGRSLTDFIVNNAPLRWSKTAYIAALTNTVKTLMRVAASAAIGLTSSELPMCVIAREKRAAFASEVSRLYAHLPDEFVQWLSRDEHLTICWIMGFKPRGDDARPDRGLPPLTRMLIGEGQDLLSVIYGPAPVETWPMLNNDPRTLADRNGLWEAILAVSDAILIDSRTDNVTRHGFLRSHWEPTRARQPGRTMLVTPMPIRIGENDVDTVLHILFARHAGTEVYEGMCNPPGGDWSGISLLSADRRILLRWLSLPRVSGTDAKRPDHVFQIFGIAAHSIILSVESKETAASVEIDIGPRLSKYILNLIATPASIEYDNNSNTWSHSSQRLNPNRFLHASAVAFIPITDTDIESVKSKANSDIIMAHRFRENGKSCEICLIPCSRTGELIAQFIGRVNLANTKILISRD